MITSNKKSNIKVMIIDDVRVNLRLLSSVVESMGYTTVCFQKAAEATEALIDEAPSLILLDAMMPDMDGFEFCNTIKNNVKTRDIPVIFISASMEAEDKKKGFEAGAVDYITKPFERSEVVARVGLQIKMYEMQQQLTQYNASLNKLVMEQNHKIEEEKRTLLYALSKVAEGKDSLTGSHIDDVQYNCRILAQSLQFSPKFEKKITNSFIDTIGVSSALHDIGKISIPDSILLKPDKLTDDEMEIMKQHSVKGANLLKDISAETKDNEFLRMSVEIAEFHHENWDGSGYPEGRKGEDIPLSARIVHVVDVYNTLMGQRCYKDAYTEEECYDIMNDGAGKLFDPDIIEIFNKVRAQFKVNW